MITITPSELADELGHVETRKGRKIRTYLRERFPRTENEKGSEWRLTPAQADDVRTHFLN